MFLTNSLYFSFPFLFPHLYFSFHLFSFSFLSDTLYEPREDPEQQHSVQIQDVLYFIFSLHMLQEGVIVFTIRFLGQHRLQPVHPGLSP